MAWLGVAAGVVAVVVGAALIRYGRRFPSKQSSTGRTGMPVPPYPWDQQRVLASSGISLALSGFTAILVSFLVGMTGKG